MIVPDCRHDDCYNEDFLTGDNHEFVRGFDWATEAVDNLFNNIDSLSENDERIECFLEEALPEDMLDEYVMDYAFPEASQENRKVETYGDFLRMKILEWLEMERNELITGMIDSLDESEYETVRNKALKANKESEHPKEYYDTRKLYFTDEKETDDEEES